MVQYGISYGLRRMTGYQSAGKHYIQGYTGKISSISSYKISSYHGLQLLFPAQSVSLLPSTAISQPGTGQR
jgi:hypothetical protein